MKLAVSVATNLKVEEVTKKTQEAARLAMRDTVVDITADAVKLSHWITGNNRRSIFFGVSGFGHAQGSGEGRQAGDTWTGEDTSLLNEDKLEGVIYSTSGYGGYLETGTFKMAPRPYFRPALDKNFGKYPGYIKKYLEE